jgi:hypothetical protein
LIKKDILFINFGFDERTKELSEYSAKINGFKNFIALNEEISFHEKIKVFIDVALKSKFNLFIRSDADRIIMPGIDELINYYKESKVKPWFLQGTGIEYIMNLNRRNATPNVYSRDCLEYLSENFYKVVPDDRKPETALSLHIRDKIDNKLFQSIKTKIPTNLHEFEQHPSKIVNAFLNRLWRGHASYYNQEYLNLLPSDFKEAIKIAVTIKKDVNSNNKFEYVSEKQMLEINPNFRLKHQKIEKIEETYQKYLKMFGG